MSPLRDLTDWIFSSFALVVACLAVFDTHRLFRLLSYGRNKELRRGQVLSVRIPGAVVITSILWRMWITIVWKP